MPSHYMKEVVASVKTKGQSQPVKTKNMTKPKNKPVPKVVRKWVPKIVTPAKSVDPKLSSEEVWPWTINEALGGRQPVSSSEE
jgi:hypothetical protein